MIDVNELRKGTTFLMEGELYQVLEYQHYKPGRGNAIIRTKLRNLRTGSTIQRNFLSGDRVEDAPVERRTAQYLYNDGENYFFMDVQNYDQVGASTELVGDNWGYLKEGREVIISLYNGRVVDIEYPPAVELEVVESEMAVAGDTATGASKMVTCETGLKVQVPLFVNVGDVIRVDTRTGAYTTRV